MALYSDSPLEEGRNQDKRGHDGLEEPALLGIAPYRSRSRERTPSPTEDSRDDNVRPITSESTSLGEPAKEEPPKEKNEGIPSAYVSLITTAFGSDVDLYHDVLQISKNATAREIRIAYFRRGREVLAKPSASSKSNSIISGLPGLQSLNSSLESSGDETSTVASAATVGGAVSHMGKMRFQAVSMAYEILTTEHMKKFYDEHGLYGGINDEPIPPPSTMRRSTSSGSLIRNKGDRRHRRAKSSNSVRWNEEVEELVILDFDPNEHSRETDGMSSGDDWSSDGSSHSGRRPRRRKKPGSRRKKKRVVVEGLEQELMHLEKNAKEHLKPDLMDDLEAGMEELFSLGSGSSQNNDSSEKKKKAKDSNPSSPASSSFSRRSKERRSSKERRNSDTARKLQREREDEGPAARQPEYLPLEGSGSGEGEIPLCPKIQDPPEEVSLLTNSTWTDSTMESEGLFSIDVPAVKNRAADPAASKRKPRKVLGHNSYTQEIADEPIRAVETRDNRVRSESLDSFDNDCSLDFIGDELMPSRRERDEEGEADTTRDFHEYLLVYLGAVVNELVDAMERIGSMDWTISDLFIQESDVQSVMEILRRETTWSNDDADGEGSMLSESLF